MLPLLGRITPRFLLCPRSLHRRKRRFPSTLLWKRPTDAFFRHWPYLRRAKADGIIAEVKIQAPVHPVIADIVRRISKQFDPQSIILFGSHARGTAGPDSDVDLLVVMNLTKSRRKQATEIDFSLMGVPLPTDILVVTPEEVIANRKNIGSTIYPALKEGIGLYERAA